MKIRKRIIAAAAVLAIAAAAGGQVLKPAPGPALDLTRFLPLKGAVPGWAAAGEIQVYKGEDLFLYINGGAEIFHEYGFRQVVAQEFKNARGETLSLEIYEMADPPAAYGMFTFKSSRHGRPIDLGQGGRVEDYYLNFWKGPCLVTITALDEAAGVREELVPLAKAVDGRIALKGERPAVMNDIPAAWTETARIVYLRGFIGLNNIRVLYPSDIFHFREAAAVEGKDFTCLIFGYASEKEAAGRLESIRRAFAASPLYKNVGAIKAGGFDAAEAKGGRLGLRLVGSRIALARTEAAGSPSALLAQLK